MVYSVQCMMWMMCDIPVQEFLSRQRRTWPWSTRRRWLRPPGLCSYGTSSTSGSSSSSSTSWPASAEGRDPWREVVDHYHHLSRRGSTNGGPSEGLVFPLWDFTTLLYYVSYLKSGSWQRKLPRCWERAGTVLASFQIISLTRCQIFQKSAVCKT